eukprot:scaffold28748_cov17-Tisochrysis_lutea.AAC.2
MQTSNGRLKIVIQARVSWPTCLIIYLLLCVRERRLASSLRRTRKLWRHQQGDGPGMNHAATTTMIYTGE